MPEGHLVVESVTGENILSAALCKHFMCSESLARILDPTTSALVGNWQDRVHGSRLAGPSSRLAHVLGHRHTIILSVATLPNKPPKQRTGASLPSDGSSLPAEHLFPSVLHKRPSPSNTRIAIPDPLSCRNSASNRWPASGRETCLYLRMPSCY